MKPSTVTWPEARASIRALLETIAHVEHQLTHPEEPAPRPAPENQMPPEFEEVFRKFR